MYELRTEEGIDRLVITKDYAIEKIEKSKFKKLKAA
jgi:ATP-dependent Clp protease ATP-binding subunit ClpX